ncbi:DUF1508 domain-containing protein [Rhizobium phaseoli]|jgi:uncharacterized protein YegP (UPF0339 family)|uniref:DUF1508 domain-containing protein n=1 Tax=Rhizobium phaseoli TaxID=396 RepID=A0A7K3UKI5_9HYPH|nr:DUF1508 domain-containing protein [Rhizobium phaseoli]NEJ74200.1 DUF1508 domain-containing protein [Rhizobium phaseoli]
MADLKPIHSEQDYNEALQVVAELWGAKSGTPDGDKLDILATLIDVYENEHFPMDVPTPEAVAFFMAEEERDGQAAGTVFEIYEDRKGSFLFRLVTGTGEIIFHSDAFPSKAEALNAIRLLQKSASESRINEHAA